MGASCNCSPLSSQSEHTEASNRTNPRDEALKESVLAQQEQYKSTTSYTSLSVPGNDETAHSIERIPTERILQSTKRVQTTLEQAHSVDELKQVMAKQYLEGTATEDEEEEESSYSEHELTEIEARKSERLNKPEPNKHGNLMRANTDSEWRNEELGQMAEDIKQELEALKSEQLGVDTPTSEHGQIFRASTGREWNEDDLKTAQKEMFDQMLYLNQTQLSVHSSSSTSRHDQ